MRTARIFLKVEPMNEREIIDIVYAEKKRQGLSYRDLQKRTGRCVNLCTSWFRGRGSIQVLSLLCLCDALDLEVIVRPKERRQNGEATECVSEDVRPAGWDCGREGNASEPSR